MLRPLGGISLLSNFYLPGSFTFFKCIYIFFYRLFFFFLRGEVGGVGGEERNKIGHPAQDGRKRSVPCNHWSNKEFRGTCVLYRTAPEKCTHLTRKENEKHERFRPLVFVWSLPFSFSNRAKYRNRRWLENDPQSVENEKRKKKKKKKKEKKKKKKKKNENEKRKKVILLIVTSPHSEHRFPAPSSKPCQI